ncbi:MAG: hypothetical protein O3B73_09165 [bacterium]|nr:hypothetical protein [bacterium]
MSKESTPEKRVPDAVFESVHADLHIRLDPQQGIGILYTLGSPSEG